MEKETLLIVEDNLALREGLSDILSIEGYQVITAENGAEALEKMRGVMPDMVLTDIAMPVMDGIVFFQKVRARPEWLSIPFVFLTARGEKNDILSAKNLGAEDYLVKPLTREELLNAVRGRLARSRQLHFSQLQRAYESSLSMLANAMERRERFTRGHVERVTAYSQALAEHIGLPGRMMEAVRFGAILHDIGKLHIQEAILYKTTPLSPEEWAIIKRHPAAGADMIKNIPFLALASPIVRHHHERWDGRGYPDGLAGEAIPRGARIVTLADSYEAMTSHRVYAPAMEPKEAYEEIMACSGKHYDPQVIAAFQACWNENLFQQIGEGWDA